MMMDGPRSGEASPLPPPIFRDYDCSADLTIPAKPPSCISRRTATMHLPLGMNLFVCCYL